MSSDPHRIPLSPRDQEIAAALMSAEEAAAAGRRGAGFGLSGLGGVALLAGAALSVSPLLVVGLALLAAGGRVLFSADDEMALLREELDRDKKEVVEARIAGGRLALDGEEIPMDELPEASLEVALLPAARGIPADVDGPARVHRLPESRRILWIERA